MLSNDEGEDAVALVLSLLAMGELNAGWLEDVAGALVQETSKASVKITQQCFIVNQPIVH